jgi:predicted TIM-barrel fold metal-dependent hydrolase
MPQIIDADAHVVEGASFFQQAFARWPELVKFQVGRDGKGGVVIEGRRYPEPEGPGAGCPPQHGLSNAPGIEPSTLEGMLRDADREGIDRMVLYPSMGLAAPTRRDPRVAAEFSALYNGYIADWCKRSGGRLFGVAVVPIEEVSTSIRMLAEAKQQGLVATLVPPALRERNLDHPDLEPFWAAAADLDMPLGVHGAPGIHLPKIGVDASYIQALTREPDDQMTAMTSLALGRLQTAIALLGRVPSGGRRGAVSSIACTSIGRSAAPGSRTAGSATRASTSRAGRSTSRASRTRRCCPRCSTRSAPIS